MDYKPSKIENIIRSHVQHYNEKRYWRMRNKVISFKGGKIKKAICMLYLFYIKRCDAFNNASLGTMLGCGATFATIPNFPHGLNGIIIAGEATIGSNCTIYHQVTIGNNGRGVPVIGNDVLIGAGAKIMGPVHIGNGVKIGANAVVVTDVPDGCTVVCDKARIIGLTE